MFTRIGSRLLLLLSLLIPAMAAQADKMISDGSYEIHYNAFYSTFLLPEVAQRHNLTRSNVRAMLNVTVLEKQADGTTRPVAADVTGEVANLLQQRQTLNFVSIEEADARYYIGDFRISNDEQLTINLTVLPEGSTSPYQIRFDQTFYTD
ncbi:DUF4426 domain-containing protein [Nitrincola sp. MINF-07-Sa-05]|uniref:DUF4426 domain-containing protein n=1 Tax=Nitrincola salilacus TaxID=3400273 RepID=UPI003917B9EE